MQDLAPYHREVNVNAEILAMYTDHLLLGITEPGNDNNYGSSAMLDVLCLQAKLTAGKLGAPHAFSVIFAQQLPRPRPDAAQLVSHVARWGATCASRLPRKQRPQAGVRTGAPLRPCCAGRHGGGRCQALNSW